LVVQEVGKEASAGLSSLIAGYLLIFAARVTDVSLSTMRTLLLVRGKRLLAASIGFFEVSVYIIALKFLFDRLDNPLSLLVYSLGFATGNLVGSYLEERMGMGYTTVQVITMVSPQELCARLRREGYGVTVWEGLGREGAHHVLNITVARRALGPLLRRVESWDPCAFVIVQDTRSTRGGILNKRSGK